MNDKIPRDYYADLGVTQSANLPAIKLAFYKLAKEHHPDKSGLEDASAFRLAREAYEKLSDDSFRKKYDQTYWRVKMHNNFQEQSRRTAAAPDKDEAQPREWSPPPTPPMKRIWETDIQFQFGKTYQEWQARDSEHRQRHPERNAAPSYDSTPRAHGLEVKMTHPATTQRCLYKSVHWKTQVGGQDFCVFCMVPSTGASRCPGCEALACRKCLEKITELERSFFGGIGLRS
ncbi:DnaJ-domain-containing protein [Dothidotthia symphoricarpi CBS 119687]|uniref:DnaJ-domain-containing protein n=1 Tax=Dothidotthia symphoricarpi CBS 119687 TaxID=1392245 RepID=A0A6A6ACV4_9PLEO|nr:DnaJ-domain-containing protein [Dothidotthia symphoricarpi CBS 119687]KAF2129732.1 DnaJ-domain-containing protein [Dothidotthia symphoricarpi CBS 119687]